MFLAIAVILRNFSQTLPIGGGGGIRVGVSGFFTKMPALLFGPWFGAAVSGLYDFFGYLLKPEGAYIFPLTLTSALGGVITGFLYKIVNKMFADTKSIFVLSLKLFVVFFISDVFVATINTPILMAFISALGKLGFWAVYIPRLVQEIVSVVLSAYVVAILLGVYKRVIK